MTIGQQIGARVRKLRTSRAESIRAAAGGIDCSATWLCHLEKGRVGNPGAEHLSRIARHFGVPLSAIVDDNDVDTVFGQRYRFKPEDRSAIVNLAQRLGEVV